MDCGRDPDIALKKEVKSSSSKKCVLGNKQFCILRVDMVQDRGLPDVEGSGGLRPGGQSDPGPTGVVRVIFRQIHVQALT